MTTAELEITLVAVLSGGEDDDPGSVTRGAAAVGRRWSSVGTLLPPPAAAAPEDSRAGEVAQLGAIAAAVAPVLPDLLAALRAVADWVRERRGRTAKIVRPDGSSIEVGGLSASDQHALVQSWIDEARPPDGEGGAAR